MTIKRSLAIPMLALMIAASIIGAAGTAAADGGDFSLDFVAAGPFTYDHGTGAGGEYADRTISKTDGVVESLEGGDFACGDRVVYFAAISVAADASGAQDIELDFSFLSEPTGQAGVGHSDLLSAAPNTGDSGMEGATGDTTASIVSEEIDTAPPPAKDTLFATVAVENLDPGEVFILRLVGLLECVPGDPTGNLQAAIDAGRVVAPARDAINVGAQTIPFQSLGEIEQPEQPTTFSIDVGACPAPGSPTTPVTITIDPPGSAVVTIDGPGGPYIVDGDGAVLDLQPGDYHADADPVDGFFMDDDSLDFTVEACPEVPEVLASVNVTLGACPPTSSDTRPATITISPAGAAQVVITGPDGFAEVVSGSGATLDLPAGDYSWEATANDGFALVGATEGALAVGSCVVEVLPRTELPETGVNLPGLAGLGLTFVLAGFGMVALSRRPSLEFAALVSHGAILRRLGGRSDWAAFFAAGSLLGRVRTLTLRWRARPASRRRRSGASGHR